MEAQQQYQGEPAAKKERKEQQDEAMEVEGVAHPAPSSSPQLQPSSTFESLPRELLFKIIEYVPEVAMEIKMASKLLSHIVDVYAKNVNIPMVQRMTFGVFKLPGSTTSDSQFSVMYNIEPKMLGLFFRRLNLLQSTIGGKTMSSFEAYKQFLEMAKTEEEKKTAADRKEKGEEVKPESMTMNVRATFDLNDADIDKHLALFAEFLGRRVAKVQVVETRDEPQLDAMEKVIAGKQVTTMRVCTSNIHDEEFFHLMRFVMMHNVEAVEFGVTKFDSEIKKDTLECLRDLSKQVRSLLISQYNNNDGNNAQQGGGSFLFGKQSADWAQLIIDLFSEKLEKLVIENKHNMDYLTLNDAEKLTSRLPELKKQLWFEASCDKFAEGIKEKKIANGFAMQADKKDTKGMLRIKHEARGPLNVEASAA